MNVSGIPAGTHPTPEASVPKAFLIPTPAGAWYAASVDRDPSRRALLLALLRGGGGFPFSLNTLMHWSGLTDRKTIAGLLFALQREGLLSGDAAPLVPPHGPLSMVLAELLVRLGNGGTMVLAEPAGLCVAYAGTSQEQAELLAARVTALDPRLRRLTTEGDGWSLGDDQSESRLSVRPLLLPPYRFLLVSGAAAELHSEVFVKLVCALSRYCLGAVTMPGLESPFPP